jgi:hypothetical protein
MSQATFPSVPAARVPRAGVLSFSAGGDLEDIHTWRLVSDQGRSMRELGRLFPELERRGFLREPIQVSVYPATLGAFHDALFIDTYLRRANLTRALHLAEVEGRPVLLLGQPLALAELLLEHLREGHPVPSHMLVLMGGYVCPVGLEQRLRAELSRTGVVHDILHGHGVAEVAPACLVGRRLPGGEVHYRLAAPHIAVDLRGARLFLRRTDTGDAVDTGDVARPVRVDGNDGWFIEPTAARLAPAVRAALSSWGPAEWDRRTGYVAATADGLRFQLRRGVPPARPEEVAFGAFEDRYDSSLLDEPRWGL